jgi:hypothetical protein
MTKSRGRPEFIVAIEWVMAKMWQEIKIKLFMNTFIRECAAAAAFSKHISAYFGTMDMWLGWIIFENLK